MKKTTIIKVIMITLALMAGYICGSITGQQNAGLTDEELIEAYIIDEYGNGNYEIEITDRNGEFVDYFVYKDGHIAYCCTTNMGYMEQLYASR